MELSTRSDTRTGYEFDNDLTNLLQIVLVPWFQRMQLSASSCNCRHPHPHPHPKKLRESMFFPKTLMDFFLCGKNDYKTTGYSLSAVSNSSDTPECLSEQPEPRKPMAIGWYFGRS